MLKLYKTLIWSDTMTFIHPTAIVEKNSKIGENTKIFEKLANIYNFKLEYTKSNSIIRTDILEKVNAFYIQELYKQKNAYEYLKKRGINDSTIEKFALFVFIFFKTHIFHKLFL